MVRVEIPVSLTRLLGCDDPSRYLEDIFMGIKAEYIQESDMEGLLSSNQPVVLDCTASWCGPCKVVGPLMDRLAGEFEDRATVVKVDIDQNQAMAKKFNIKSIPAVIYLKDSEEVNRVIGVEPYEVFHDALASLV